MKSYLAEDIFQTAWDGLSPKQAVLNIRLKGLADKALRQRRMTAFGMYTDKLLKSLCTNKKVYRKLTSDQKVDLLPLAGFIDQPYHHFIVKSINSQLGPFYSPGEKLWDLVFWQFCKADAEFSKYIIKNDIIYLDRLIAILYQPKNDKVKIKFLEQNIDGFAAMIAGNLAISHKELILWNYGHCRNYIVKERCNNLFPDDGGKSPRDNPKYTGDMWQELMFNLADAPAFNGIENAKYARLYDALDYLDKKAKDAKEMEIKMKGK